MKSVTIGTRGSKLALWQAEFTQSELKKIGIESQLKIIKTKGDQIQHLSFDKIEGKGFFTKEIEQALLDGEIDLAVHSMKDMPTSQPEGLCISALSYREDSADALIVRKDCYDQNTPLGIPKNGIVGTSSARRKAQIKYIRNDIQLNDIRGNVPTRLKKLQDGQFDAILLATAGINRLNIDMSPYHFIRLSPKEFIPAPAQGVLAWQCKKEDKTMRRILKNLHQKDVADCTNIERRVLQLMDGGCHLPLGVYCEKDTLNNYHVWSVYSHGVDQPLRFFNMSSRTTNQLAESIVDALTKTDA